MLDWKDNDMVFVLVAASSGCCILCCSIVCCWRDAARRERWAHQARPAFAAIGQESPAASMKGSEADLEASMAAAGLGNSAALANRSLLTGYVMPVRRLDVCTQGRRAAKVATKAAGAAAAMAKRQRPRACNNAQKSYAKVTAVAPHDGERRVDELARLYCALGEVDNVSESSTPRRVPQREKKRDFVSELHHAARHLETGGSGTSAPSRPEKDLARQASNRSGSAKALSRSGSDYSDPRAKRNKDEIPDASRKDAKATDGRGAGSSASSRRQREARSKIETPPIPPLTPPSPSSAVEISRPAPADVRATPVAAAVVPAAPPGATAVPATVVGRAEQQAGNVAHNGSRAELEADSDVGVGGAAHAADVVNELMGKSGDLLEQIELPPHVNRGGNGVNARQNEPQRGNSARDEKFDSLDAELSIELEDGNDGLNLVLHARSFPGTRSGLPAPSASLGLSMSASPSRGRKAGSRRSAGKASLSPPRGEQRDSAERSKLSPERPPRKDSLGAHVKRTRTSPERR